MSRTLARAAGQVVALAFLTWLSGCGSGSSDVAPAEESANNVQPPAISASSYTVGGSVAGLAGTLVLQNSGSSDLTLSTNSGFSFVAALPTGSSYSVTVLSQPSGQDCVVANGMGTVGAANVSGVTVICSALPPSLALFAGSMDSSGSADGAGAAAGFNLPEGLATDSSGNLYVADRGNHTIRKITSGGNVSTLAGTAGVTGSADANGAAASFNGPTGVGTDSAGNLYVADTSNSTIRKITPDSTVTTLAGTAGVRGADDGTGPAATFQSPHGGATDSAGNVYTADGPSCSIRRTTPAGVVSKISGMPGLTCSGAGRDAGQSFGVAIDHLGSVYVAQSRGAIIVKVSPAGAAVFAGGPFGPGGSPDTTGAPRVFSNPLGVATDSAGNLYVADAGNHTVRKITPDGAVSTIVGVAGVAGFAPGPLPGLLTSPSGVAVSGNSLYITLNHGVVVVRNLP